MVKVQSVNLEIRVHWLLLQVTIQRGNKDEAVYCANISNLLEFKEEDLELKSFIEKTKLLLQDLEKQV